MSRGETEARPFRILSLDGGGILGAFTASFLADVERRLNCKVGDHFDLIAGTSTGGIIAAAVAAGEPASRIVKFYKERGPRIFQRQTFGFFWDLCAWPLNWLVLGRFGLDLQSIVKPNYGSDDLAGALKEVFGDRTIGDITRSRLLLTSVDLVQGQTVVFKTPHLADMIRDRHYRLADAVLATTAAPTFFKPSQIAGKGAYADGGLWANNPSMVALTEAIRISETCRRPADPQFTLNSVYCLSVGTGKGLYFHKPKRPPGVGWWLAGKKIITVMMTSQAQGVDFQTGHILGDRYHRVDYTVPHPSWTLDSVERIDDLIDLGEKKAAEELGALRDVFFSAPADPYSPFADATTA